LIIPGGRCYVFRAESNGQRTSWVDRINYISALTVANVSVPNFDAKGKRGLFHSEGVIDNTESEKRKDNLKEIYLAWVDDIKEKVGQFQSEVLKMRQIYIMEPINQKVASMLNKHIQRRQQDIIQITIQLQKSRCFCKIWLDDLKEHGVDVEELEMNLPDVQEPVVHSFPEKAFDSFWSKKDEDITLYPFSDYRATHRSPERPFEPAVSDSLTASTFAPSHEEASLPQTTQEDEDGAESVPLPPSPVEENDGEVTPQPCITPSTTPKATDCQTVQGAIASVLTYLLTPLFRMLV
jgi:hypothetical protein